MNMKNLHLCSGLPRSGSTVLMNILQQNPEVFTTTTDPLPFILHKKILTRSRYNEQVQAMSVRQADAAYHGLITYGAQGWYSGLTNKPSVISKARNWSDLHHLFPKSKILVTIRDLRDVIESFDKLNSSFAAYDTLGQNDTPYNSMTENEKLSYYLDFKETSLHEGLNKEVRKLMYLWNEQPERIQFLRYEDFLKDPIYIIEKVYEFLELKPYKHDLNNITQSEMFEHDNAYFAEKTEHVTKPQLLPWKEPNRKLSDGFHNHIINSNKWFYEAFYPEVLK